MRYTEVALEVPAEATGYSRAWSACLCKWHTLLRFLKHFRFTAGKGEKLYLVIVLEFSFVIKMLLLDFQGQGLLSLLMSVPKISPAFLPSFISLVFFFFLIFLKFIYFYVHWCFAQMYVYVRVSHLGVINKLWAAVTAMWVLGFEPSLL